jgi:hypothetical protein
MARPVAEQPATIIDPAESLDSIARLLSEEADAAALHVLPAQPSRASATAGTAGPRITPIGSVTGKGKVIVEGRVRVVEIRPVERNSVLAVEISDHTGNLTAMFYGRSHIPGLVCGARVRLTGSITSRPPGQRDPQPVLINPAYELLFPSKDE